MIQLTIAEPVTLTDGQLAPDAPIWRAADAMPYRVGTGLVPDAPPQAWTPPPDADTPAPDHPAAPTASAPHDRPLQIVGMDAKAALALMGLTPPPQDDI